jgi:hypothetical protein
MRLLPFFFAVPALAHGAVETFVETFDGDGPYQSITNDLVGFDNPGWEVYSDDGFAAGGFHFQNDGHAEQEEVDILERTLTGVGSFRMTVELNDLDMGEITEQSSPLSFGKISVRLRFHEDPAGGINSVYMLTSESLSDGQVWSFGADSSFAGAGGDVPRGPRVVMEMMFDATKSEITYTYDNDRDDEIAPIQFGPLAYTGATQGTLLLTIVTASNDSGKFDGVLDFLSITPFSDIEGDFNGNGILDAADIDQLSEQVRSTTNDPLYDLSADSLVDDLDRQVWVHDLKQTYFGDADLNGSFDSTDLVQVLASGEYEDDVALNSTWITGDWDGDGDFTSGDLVVALADGGYDAVHDAAAVPEPAGVVLAMAASAVVATCSRRRPKTRRQ